MKISRAKFLLCSCIALCLLCLADFVLTFQRYRDQVKALGDEAATMVRPEISRGRAEIERNLRRIMGLVDGVALDLGTGALSKSAFVERLRRTIYAESHVAELGLAFAPFAYDPGLRLHGVAFAVKGLAIEETALDASRDYTEAGTTWYHKPISSGAVWLEPALDAASGSLRATYAVPFRLQTNGPPAGVVYASYSVDHLSSFVDSMDLGDNGYAYITSANGICLAHPNRDYLNGQTSILNVARASNDTALEDLATEALAGRHQSGTKTNPRTGASSWVISEPIQAAGWSMGMIVGLDGLGSPTTARKQLIRMGLSLSVGLVFGILLIIHIGPWARWKMWSATFSIAAIGFGCVAYVLNLASLLLDPGVRQETSISHRSMLNGFVASQNRKTLMDGGELPLPLRTGIMVQSIAFLSSREVRVSGRIWQRYEDGIHKEIVRGFMIPQADSLDVVESYRRRVEGAEVVGWSFKAVLHQSADYSRFPFVEEMIRVAIWPKDLQHNVLLIPDLESYPLIRPSAKPGIQDGLVLPNWDVETTRFSYEPRSSKAQFGFDANAALTSLPELHFDIIGKKQIIGPLITYLLPLGVVLIMLFGLLFLTSRDEKKFKLLGFDAMKVLQTCGGFFLVVIFSQIDLRKTLGTRDVVYMEYFHFTVYASILAVALSAVAFARADSGPFHSGDNFVCKLLYWPLIAFGILSFTLATFY